MDGALWCSTLLRASRVPPARPALLVLQVQWDLRALPAPLEQQGHKA